MGQACTKILVVDQDAATRDYAARVAENGGYFACEAAHAGEALDALASDPQLQVIVAANQWRNDIDGIALAGTVRCFWPQVAIVLVSDRVLPSDADLPLDTVVLTKPFTPNELVEAVAEALRGRMHASPSPQLAAEPMPQLMR